jgi:hypothetical protein
VSIQGNQASRHFAVSTYDDKNNQIDLIVNTTDAYSGTVPINFMDGEVAVAFEVKATGDWTIQVIPLSQAPIYDGETTITGEGDSVFVMLGVKKTATIEANAGGNHFALISYGDSRELLVNTTDPYSGKVLIPSDAIVFEIKAVGEWSITFED